MSKKSNEIELYIEKNYIWEHNQLESKDYKAKNVDWYYPNLNEYTIHRWNLITLAWNVAKNVFEFEKICNEVDVMQVLKWNTFKMLSEFKGIYNGK